MIKKIQIEMEVEERWIPQFLGMLYLMKRMGTLGCSRTIGFYADGDGDFRPEFKINGKEFNGEGSELPILERIGVNKLFPENKIPKTNTIIKADILFDAK